MNRTKVSSSNVSSVGFENGVLEVEFHGGSIYRYSGVSENIFNNFIKNQYWCVRLR
jgi:hypothetical protein